jgi:hypothetical protein
VDYFMLDFLFTETCFLFTTPYFGGRKRAPLSNIKSESLVWLDNLAALEAQLQKIPSATHGQLADALNLKRPYVSLLLALQPILDPTAIEKVRSSANNSFVLSFNAAKALLPLGKMANPSSAVQSALDVILSRRLAPKHIAALVDEMISGKSAETFDPKAKRPKPVRKTQDKLRQHAANNNDNYEGSATWALLDYLIKIGVKPSDLRAVYWEMIGFQSNPRNKNVDLKEFGVYVERLLKDYGVKVNFALNESPKP